jgi:hypothetical protein
LTIRAIEKLRTIRELFHGVLVKPLLISVRKEIAMLGVGHFIRRFETPLQAEMVLMHHYAAKQKALHQWDRRYAHLQFVMKWAPLFRRHIAPIDAHAGSQGTLAA